MDSDLIHAKRQKSLVKPELVLLYQLSEREAEILELMILQYSNPEIGLHINLSRNTIKFHIKSILGKLGVNTRQEAARKVIMSVL